MDIAVIVAMDKELRLLLPLLGQVETEAADGCTFYCGAVGGNRVVAMQCGIGKVNAAVGAATLIGKFGPRYVINTGVAGGADEEVGVMDIVVGRQVTYHDVWCGPGCQWGTVQGLPSRYEAAPALLASVPRRDDLHMGLICSGDQFVDTGEKIAAIKQMFPDALAVDMESASIAQVCHLRGVGFMSLRVISDLPGPDNDNTRQYVDFWEDAPRHTFDVLRQMLLRIG